jgi:hypothetical protein
LGVRYIVLHEDPSAEPYRDFKNSDRYAIFNIISQRNGNIIYDTGHSWARIAGQNILKAPKPVSGNDANGLAFYTDFFRQDIEAEMVKPGEIRISAPELAQEEVISLSMTYDRGWHSQNAKVISDKWGHIALIPEREGEIRLSYQPNWQGSVWGAILVVVAIGGLLFSDKLSQKLQNKLGDMNLEDNEQENY